ncbi:hypothetical protein DPMN_079095 [Dreissena polymorpha]|uniref:Uncharacterized protein n=1 Tax=Dreissena polymorpha TaxID=45954 RepID=A0A9D4BI34_DREPO|nr:hypothetical protein DPMN_079095 [Dreissena polymorpha]
MLHFKFFVVSIFSGPSANHRDHVKVSIAAVAAHVAEPAADRVLHSVGSELQPAPDCKAAYPGEVTAE